MPISTMLVPLGSDPHEFKILRYVCGLSVQSVRRVLVATVVDDSGMEAPVVAAEMDRARERLSEWTHEVAKNCPMELETRVVTGDTTGAVLALAQQADVDVICCSTEGKTLLEALFSGSVSEELFASGKVRTMVVRNELLDSVDDPSELAHNFARRLVVPTDFSASATRTLSTRRRKCSSLWRSSSPAPLRSVTSRGPKALKNRVTTVEIPASRHRCHACCSSTHLATP